MCAKKSVQGPNRDERKPELLRRRGAIVVLSAILMIVFMGMLAFSVDTGYMFTMQTQLQRSVDAAALAGAGALVDGQEQAQASVVEYLVRNPVGSAGLTKAADESLEYRIQEFLAHFGEELEIEMGHWNPDAIDPATGRAGLLELSNELPSTIGVRMTYPNQNLFFGRLLGRNHFNVSAQSVAMYQPRDIVLVLDLSGSMNDDSEFKSISTFGRDFIESNLLTMYQQLGSPTYGTLEFEPQYATVVGQPPQYSSQPQIEVEYRNHEVRVESTKPLSRVVLRFSNNNNQTFSSLSGYSGTFKGSGSNKNKTIERVTVRSGSNGSGEVFDFSSGNITNVIKKSFGLNNVPYPYNSGNWNSFIDYARSSSGQNKNAGYRYKFGHMNLINYWLEQKPSNYETADLWKVNAQPITAVKNSVDVFMDYIREVDTNDRVGLAVYNASNGNGKLESPLSHDFDAVAAIAMQRQAGHYHDYTNIGAGMEAARAELAANGRPGAFKMIVLMTDGLANWVNGGYNEYQAVQYVLSEANAAADSHYPILTISLGAGADAGLMNQVAYITKGRHFNIPGGQTVEEYSEELLQVFREIADSRPLKIVK